jgi:hypothetical protein
VSRSFCSSFLFLRFDKPIDFPFCRAPTPKGRRCRKHRVKVWVGLLYAEFLLAVVDMCRPPYICLAEKVISGTDAPMSTALSSTSLPTVHCTTCIEVDSSLSTMSAAPHSVVHATNFVQEEDKKDANGKGSVSLAGQGGGVRDRAGPKCGMVVGHNSGDWSHSQKPGLFADC